jgi:hypothetical protein
VRGVRHTAATLLAWHNKNAKQAPAALASLIEDFVKGVNAFKD